MATTLATVLGHDEIAHSIAGTIEDADALFVIEGPPGVGKSWLAKGIGALWAEHGGSTMLAEGDALQGDTPFYALNLALAALSGPWRAVGSDLITVSKSGERVVGTGGLITGAIQAIARLRPTRQRARKLYLGEVEQQILFELERAGGRRPLLLVADNLHWWDEESLELLGRLRTERMTNAFPFLRSMRVIAVQTVEPYQATAHPVARDHLVSGERTQRFRLERPSRMAFDDVLMALGAPPKTASESAGTIYDLTGGHLLLADRCVRRMQREGGLQLAVADKDTFLERLLTDRVRSLGSFGTGTLALLQIAAVLGLRFRRAEVVCAFDGEPSDALKLLRDCRDEQLIELTEDVGRFVHDLFRQHFLSAGQLDLTSVHESVSDCLRQLRPGAYVLRCRHARHAEQTREAGALAVQAALERQREGLEWETLSEDVLNAIDAVGMRPVVETFQIALDHLNSYRSRDCHEALHRLPRNLPRRLVAEADYLRAMCLIGTRSDEDRDRAQATLEAWDGYEEKEFELGIRLMHLRLYALTLVVDKAPGRKLEGRIQQVLLDRAEYDPVAEDAMYTLDRCSGSFYEPDACLPRTYEAMLHYGPAPNHSVLRRPVEYYRCLVNYGAKLVTNASYEEALAVYEKLEELVADYASDTFPRLDYPRSAALLAKYRLGIVTAAGGVERQRQIASEHGVAGDPFYNQNALAVYLTLAGDGAQALEIFDQLEAELERRSRPAASMRYLISANRCATRYVTGSEEAAYVEWIELAGVVEEIPYLIRKYLIPRHQLLGDVMELREAAQPVEFDECLVAEDRYGPLWDQLGRGFRMPEVEWWR